MFCRVTFLVSCVSSFFTSLHGCLSALCSDFVCAHTLNEKERRGKGEGKGEKIFSCFTACVIRLLHHHRLNGASGLVLVSVTVHAPIRPPVCPTFDAPTGSPVRQRKRAVAPHLLLASVAQGEAPGHARARGAPQGGRKVATPDDVERRFGGDIYMFINVYR